MKSDYTIKRENQEEIKEKIDVFFIKFCQDLFRFFNFLF